MGFKIKSILSVHIYSQRKKLELCVKDAHTLLNLFLQIIARHPESITTMQQTGPRRRQ